MQNQVVENIAFFRNNKWWCYIIKKVNNDYIVLEKQDGVFVEIRREKTLKKAKDYIDFYELGSQRVD